MIRSKFIFASLLGLVIAAGIVSNAHAYYTNYGDGYGRYISPEISINQYCPIVNGVIVVEPNPVHNGCNFILAATETATNGTYISVQPGTYYEYVGIGINMKEMLFIAGAGRDQTTIIFNGSESPFAIKAYNSPLLDISGLNIENHLPVPTIHIHTNTRTGSSRDFVLTDSKLTTNDPNGYQIYSNDPNTDGAAVYLGNNIFNGGEHILALWDMDGQIRLINNTFVNSKIIRTKGADSWYVAGNLFRGVNADFTIDQYKNSTKPNTGTFDHNTFLQGAKLTLNKGTHTLTSNTIDNISRAPSPRTTLLGEYNYNTTGDPLTLP